MHPREAAEELLAGLVVAASVSVGSSSARRLRAVPIFSSSPFAFGSIAKLITGLGKIERRDVDRLVGGEQDVACGRLLELGHRAEVALAELLRQLVVLALEEQQLADTLLVARARVDERRVGRERAREHAEEVDAPGERVGDRLEDERGRPAAVDVHGERLLGRRRNALDKQVEEPRGAEVLRRDAARDREDLARDDGVLERGGELVA